MSHHHNFTDINDGDIFDPDNIPNPELLEGFIDNLDQYLTPFYQPYFPTIDMDNEQVIKNTERQFIQDILISRDDDKWNSLCMGKHPRIGKESPLRLLPSDIFATIRKFHRKDIQSMIDEDTVEDILLITEQTNCSVQTAVDVYIETNRDTSEAISRLWNVSLHSPSFKIQN
mgnify:FL=1